MDATEDFIEIVGIHAGLVQELEALLAADASERDSIFIFKASMELWEISALLPCFADDVLFLALACFTGRLADEVTAKVEIVETLWMRVDGSPCLKAGDS